MGLTRRIDDASPDEILRNADGPEEVGADSRCTTAFGLNLVSIDSTGALPMRSTMRSTLRTLDVPFEQVRSAPNWRARFFEAAANASVALVEYSLRHKDSANAAVWMERLEFFREKARLYS